MGLIERIEGDPTLLKEFERTPTDDVVIVGFSQRTGLGGTQETWRGMLEGRSAIRKLDVSNPRTNIGGPVEFSIEDYFDKRESRDLSLLSGMAIVSARDAGFMAGLIDPATNKLWADLQKRRVSTCVSSGMATSDRLIDAYLKIHTKEEISDGVIRKYLSDDPEDMLNGAKKIRPNELIKSLPEEINSQVAISLGCAGWQIIDVEACATGLAAIVEGQRLVREGLADIVFAGAFEDVLSNHPEVAVGLFASTRGALSVRNDEPERACRPFDINRDGFILASGGGLVVLMRGDLARERGVKVYARVLGGAKSQDGHDSTEMEPESISYMILNTLYDRKEKKFHRPGAIFTHATSTQFGDMTEARILKEILGDSAKDIPVTAIKSWIGHLAGGAGAVNTVSSVIALNENEIPAIGNLENLDPECEGLNYVVGKPLKKKLNSVLVLAYGFGGNNAGLLLAA